MKKTLASAALTIAFSGAITPAFAMDGETPPETAVSSSSSSTSSVDPSTEVEASAFKVKVVASDSDEHPVQAVESIRPTVEDEWVDSKPTVVDEELLKLTGSDASDCDDSLRRLSLTVGDLSVVLCETADGWVEMDPLDDDDVTVDGNGIVFDLTKTADELPIAEEKATFNPERFSYGTSARMAVAPKASVPRTVKSMKTESTPGISGNVYFDLNKNGEYDGDDKPVANREVYLKSSGSKKTVKTDSNGVYQFSGITPDAYQVSVNLKGSKLTQVWVSSSGKLPSSASVDFDGLGTFNDVDFGLTMVAGSSDTVEGSSSPTSSSSSKPSSTKESASGSTTESSAPASDSDETSNTDSYTSSDSDERARGRVDSGSIAATDGRDMKVASLSGFGMVAGALLAGFGLRRKNAYVRRH